jgi:hypothetical protein
MQVGVTFFLGLWLFMTVAAVAGMITEYKKRQLQLEPLRAAIDRGQQLDPAIIDRLMGREQQELNPLSLRIGGIIAIAVGCGLAALSWFVAQAQPRALYPILGAGVLVVCVGVGLIVAARAIDQHRRAGRTELAVGPRQ